MDKILQTVLYYLEKDTRKQIDFLKYLGLSSSAISDWKTGKSTSYVKYLPKIADYFSVSADMIINGYGKDDMPFDMCKIPVVDTLPETGACVNADNVKGYDCAQVRFANEYFFFEQSEKVKYLIHRQNYADEGDTVLLKKDGGRMCKLSIGGSVAVFVFEDGSITTLEISQMSGYIAGVAKEVRRALP